MFKRLELLEGFRDKVFKIRMGLGGERGAGRGCHQLVAFFGLVDGEIIRSQHHQPSGSNLSWVYMLVGSI